jgi:excisionase family DNA binding protein
LLSSKFGMGKNHVEFAVGELPAPRHKPAAESAPEERGKIPSWALQPFDLDEWRVQAPSGLIPSASPHSVDKSSTPTGPPIAPLMTVAEAATALRVSPKTIRRMIARGELHHVRIGRLVRTRAKDIVQYIRAHASV